MKEELLALYVESHDGRILELENASLEDIKRAIGMAKDANGIFTWAPASANVVVMQLLDFSDEECNVYVVSTEDDCVGKVTHLPISDAIALVERVLAGVAPDCSGWGDYINEEGKIATLP